MDAQARLQQIIKRINDHPFKAFIISLVILLFTTVIIVLASIFLSYFTLLPFVYSINQNCTLVSITSFVNENTSGFIGIFSNSMLTLGIIIFSALSLSSAQNALKQSQKQQEQFQDEQRIRDIEKRLEFFYIPADDIINGQLKRNHEQTIKGGPTGSGVDGLICLRKYSYLANKSTYEAYETYIKSSCTKVKEVTCQDKYKNKPKGFTVCEDYKSGCYNQFNKCSHNLDYCKHYNECPLKDQLGIIQDNTKCKYYLDLKDKITKDIESYKNELLILKK